MWKGTGLATGATTKTHYSTLQRGEAVVAAELRSISEQEYREALAQLEARLDYGREIDPQSPAGCELLRLVDIVEAYESALADLAAQ